MTVSAQQTVIAELFAAGDYATVTMTGGPDEWQTYAAMGLIGRPREAVEGLSRFNHQDACFYSAVASWIDGDERTAAGILENIPTAHAQNLLALIRKPQIQVLAQLPWSRHVRNLLKVFAQDGKFQVKNIGFDPQDLQNEPHADIHKFYDSHNPPDFYICQMVEWHQIPPNVQELPCPVFGETGDYDIHIQTVYPWLQVFDELLVLDSLAWQDMRRLAPVSVSTYPKSFGVPVTLPPMPTGPRNIDVFQSGTALHPYHPDKAQLFHQVLKRPNINFQIFNKFLDSEDYHKLLGESKVCLCHVRNPAAMPSRALDALSMGCAVAVQKGNMLTLYVGEKHGVLTYELEADNLASTIRHVLDNWPEFEQRARQGAAIIRREFALPKVASQFLRFLTFLAAKPRGQRRMQPMEQLIQKRSTLKKGWFPPGGSDSPVLAELGGSTLEKLQTCLQTEGLSSRLLIDSAREIVLCCCDAPAESGTAAWLTKSLNIYRTGIANFPKSLVLRLNLVRTALHSGQPQDIKDAMQLALETVSMPESNWQIDVMEDVFPWDFCSTSFNYRKYFDLVTEHISRGAPVNSALTRLILASLHYCLGHYSKSPDHFRQAATLDPEFPFYRFSYAKRLIERGEPDDYLKAGELLTELAGNSILFVEAFSLLQQLQEKQLYMSPRYEELATMVFDYSFRYLMQNTYSDGSDFTTVLLNNL